MQFATLKRLAITIAIWPVLFGAVAVAQTEKAEARLLDQFGDIQSSDLIARLDNLAIQLQQEPDVKGFVVVYRTRRDLPGLSNRYAHRMKSYLVNSRGVSAARVVTVDGGEASCLTQELWIVPSGTAPKPRADAYQNSYTPSVAKFDEHYIGDDEGSYWANDPVDFLEAYGLELQKYPKSIAYLVAYRGMKARGGHKTEGELKTRAKFPRQRFSHQGIANSDDQWWFPRVADDGTLGCV